MKPESLNNTSDPRSDDPRACLSALADGDTQASDAAYKLWRDDPEMRKTWHAYQLIGDVMRSEELARAAPRDAAFLAGIRERLATEPVVLAPMPVVAAAPRRQAWLLPVAAAAGFVVVAGVLVVSRVSEPGVQPAPSMAAASAADGVLRVGIDTARPSLTVTPDGDALVRNARLDEYLRAHQFARGGVAVAAPGGGLRRVEMTVPAVPAR